MPEEPRKQPSQRPGRPPLQRDPEADCGCDEAGLPDLEMDLPKRVAILEMTAAHHEEILDLDAALLLLLTSAVCSLVALELLR